MTRELTLRQLRCRAKERGIEGYSRMNKGQLIAALAEEEEAHLVNSLVQDLARSFEQQWPDIKAQLDRN